MKLEQTILKNLIYNEEFLRKVLPFLKPEYFSDSTEKVLYNEITSFTETYNNSPSIEAISIAVKERRNLTDDEVKRCESYLQEIETGNKTET
jgi:replicative DNA helicase